MIYSMTTKRITQLILLMLAMITLTGIAVPTVAAQTRQPPDAEEWVANRLVQLTERLTLSEDQQISIRPHLEGMMAEMQALRKTAGESGKRSPETRAAMKLIRDTCQGLIEEELTDSQRELYRELLEEEKQEQRQQHQRRGGERNGGRQGRGGGKSR